MLDTEPPLVIKYGIEWLTVWEYEVDGDGQPMGEGKKLHTFYYDDAGFKRIEITYDTLGRFRDQIEYFGRDGEASWMTATWNKTIKTDVNGKVLEVREGRINEDGVRIVAAMYWFFKPCYFDYLYEFDERNLKKSAVKVVAKDGNYYMPHRPTKAVKYYRFEYGF